MLSFAPSLGSRFRRAAAVLAVIGLCTCENIDNFEIPVNAEATVPKATLIDELLGPLEFAGFNSIDLSQDFRNQGVTEDDIDSVHIKSMTFKIKAPAGANFDFLESLTFFAETTALANDKVQIASLAEVPKGKTELEMVVNQDVDLRPYATAPKMKLTSSIKGKRPPEETTVTATVLLDVDIHIPGCN